MKRNCGAYLGLSITILLRKWLVEQKQKCIFT